MASEHALEKIRKPSILATYEPKPYLTIKTTYAAHRKPSGSGIVVCDRVAAENRIDTPGLLLDGLLHIYLPVCFRKRLVRIYFFLGSTCDGLVRIRIDRASAGDCWCLRSAESPLVGPQSR